MSLCSSEVEHPLGKGKVTSSILVKGSRKPVNGIGMWLSLVERLVRDEEVGGSNPLIPTILLVGFSDTHCSVA